MFYLAGQITLSLVAAALLGAMVGWTLRGDVIQTARVTSENSRRPS